MNDLLPIIIDGKIRDGKVLKCAEKCKEKYNDEPCRTFYEKTALK